MAENTKIEWCDATFNPWWGCQKVSPGCDYCYAETLDRRTGGSHWGPGAERRRTKDWSGPRRWNKRAAAAGVRERVFCASMADVFDNAVPVEWRADLWTLIAETPHLDWLLLTKRPQNIAKMLPASWGDGWSNVWLGTTVENQEEADRRIPHLLAAPAAVRFLSCEPLLGPVDLTNIMRPEKYELNALDGHDFDSGATGERLDWVICGGESGSGARPMHPDWARSLRDQCEEAGVAFHFKQWGEWVAELQSPEDAVLPSWGRRFWPDAPPLWRTGKKVAGRLLDGREHNEFPPAAAEPIP